MANVNCPQSETTPKLPSIFKTLCSLTRRDLRLKSRTRARNGTFHTVSHSHPLTFSLLLSEVKMKNLRAFVLCFFPIVLAGLAAEGCKKEPPVVPGPTLSLTAVDASCTEAWLRVTATEISRATSNTLTIGNKRGCPDMITQFACGRGICRETSISAL